MGLLTLPLSLIFAGWATWCLITGVVRLPQRGHGVGSWLTESEEDEYYSRHDTPVQFWIGVIALYAASAFFGVLTVVLSRMGLAW